MAHQQKYGSRRRSRTGEPSKEKRKFADIAETIIGFSDLVLEVLNARFVDETRNLESEKLIESLGKKIIFVLNKSDLIDINKIKENLPKDLFPYVFMSCKSRKGVSELRRKIKIEIKRLKDIDYTRKYVGVIGYPNTGKSSLVNILRGKKVARTSVEAGFTRGMQKIKIAEGIFLIDTPGVIPDKEFYKERAMKTGKHTLIGVRNYSQIKDPSIEVYNIFRRYPRIIEKFYGFENLEFDDFIEKLGRKKNFIIKGNIVDEARTYRMILREWQEGKIKTD